MNWLFLFLALGILLWFIALFRLKAYIRRRTGADYTLENLREEVRLLEAAVDEKTEQSLALLEEKIKELREICAETEKHITVYGRELALKKAEEEAFAALSRGAQKTAEVPALPEKPRRKKTQSPAAKAPGRKRAGSLLDSLEVREAARAYKAQTRRPKTPPPDVLPPAAEEHPRFAVSANPISPKAPPMKERVAELYRAGFSEDLVAARLGISVTEARLYIAMASGDRTY
jgi:hypothetical protein